MSSEQKWSGLMWWPSSSDSEFIIKVRDINDHEPQFLDGPYVATVPEMSPEGMTCYKINSFNSWLLLFK